VSPCLRDAMLRKPVAQRQGMLRQMNAALLPILEKGLVSPSLVRPGTLNPQP